MKKTKMKKPVLQIKISLLPPFVLKHFSNTANTALEPWMDSEREEGERERRRTEKT